MQLVNNNYYYSYNMCRSDNILSKDSSVSLQRDACDRDDTHSHTLSLTHTRHVTAAVTILSTYWLGLGPYS